MLPAEISRDNTAAKLFATALACVRKCQTLSWYDAPFLIRFEAAKLFLAHIAPGELDRFEQAFQPLRTDPRFRTHLERGLLSGEKLAEARDVVSRLQQQDLETHEKQVFGRYTCHNLPAFDTLHRDMAVEVSRWANEPVEPTYSFTSMYEGGGILNPHLDSPRAKYTLDICLSQNTDWPIFVSEPTEWPKADNAALSYDVAKLRQRHSFDRLVLQPGDAALFSGSSQWHYRDPIGGDGGRQCTLLFLHFCPAGTSDLVEPERWADYFGIADLKYVPMAFQWFKTQLQGQQSVRNNESADSR